MFTLKLADDPQLNHQIKGNYTVTDGGVLKVWEEGLAPRVYAPGAWVSIEDFRRDEIPTIDEVFTG
ncbi:hypothetical protein FXB39_00645 [Nocardioides sp. BGMRC 2183]|nr:hypothetical protein FXB39_00645 [Nocardioides sp. BGMRC 2183]